MAEATAGAPQIAPDDLSAFHAAHFSAVSTDHFAEHFLGPVEESYQGEAEEDDLGYYPDGVKRALTDEQIAIFRHSEIQALLKERRREEGAREDKSSSEPSKALSEDGEVEDGELGDDSPVVETPRLPPAPKEQPPAKKARKTQRGKQKSFYKQHVKPDLRKRTWDKVGAGMDSLSYDEESGSAASRPKQSAQRRRISYDDD